MTSLLASGKLQLAGCFTSAGWMGPFCVVDMDDFFDQFFHPFPVGSIFFRQKILFEDSIESFGYRGGVPNPGQSEEGGGSAETPAA